MAGNVLTWKQAIQKGLQPTSYRYHQEAIPMGEFSARLDFKIWARKTMGIHCYFSVENTEKKILLTVYCSRNGRYALEDHGIDFVSCPVERVYNLVVMANQKGKISLLLAEIAT